MSWADMLRSGPGELADEIDDPQRHEFLGRFPATGGWPGRLPWAHQPAGRGRVLLGARRHPSSAIRLLERPAGPGPLDHRADTGRSRRARTAHLRPRRGRPPRREGPAGRAAGRGRPGPSIALSQNQAALLERNLQVDVVLKRGPQEPAELGGHPRRDAVEGARHRQERELAEELQERSAEPQVAHLRVQEQEQVTHEGHHDQEVEPHALGRGDVARPDHPPDKDDQTRRPPSHEPGQRQVLRDQDRHRIFEQIDAQTEPGIEPGMTRATVNAVGSSFRVRSSEFEIKSVPRRSSG